MLKAMRGASVAVLAGAMVVSAVSAAGAAPAQGDTRRVSVSATGAQVSGDSALLSISGDGRFVAFQSEADDLVPGDGNGQTDVFLRDLRRGTIERISVRDDGGEYSYNAYDPRISADGRYVTFQASTGTPGDGYYAGVYLWDRLKDRTEVVSLSDDDTPVSGTGGTRISRDGRYVTFVSGLKENSDDDSRMGAGVYVRDRLKGTTRLVSPTEPPTSERYGWIIGDVTMSADGSRIGYGMGQARPGLKSNIYVHDTRSGRTDLFAVSDQTGVTVPTFSGDGRYAAFASPAGDLVPKDTNGTFDVFVRDLRKGTIERVSLDAGGGQLDSASNGPVISEDGRRVAFTSGAANLVAGETAHGPLFTRDLRTGVNQRVTVAHDGGESDAQGLGDLAVSYDGRVVAFTSWATDLVPGDTNDQRDAFVRRVG